MTDLYENLEIIQFILISLFILYQNNLNTEEILDKESIYYKFLLNIISYNNITRKSIEYNLKNKISEINNDIFLKNNEYFYIFSNKNNVYVYFFQEKISKKHFIYFNGFSNIKDVKTIFNIIINNITYESIFKVLNKSGIFYKINNNKIEELNNKITVFEIFDYLYKNTYINDKVELSINGYSLGGPYSQVFINTIITKYNNLNIELYNVESWFFGNEDNYNIFKNNIKIYNIYNNKSILYFYNNIFQDYNKCNYILNDNNNNKIREYFKYFIKIAPYGVIKYIKDNHILSKIMSD